MTPVKPMPLGDSGHIDTIPDFEKIGGLDFLADFILRHIVKAKLSQHLESTLAGLRHVALPGFVDPLRLLAAKTDLKRSVSVAGNFFLLHHNTRTRLHNGDGNHVPLGIVELRHANFSAN